MLSFYEPSLVPPHSVTQASIAAIHQASVNSAVVSPTTVRGARPMPPTNQTQSVAAAAPTSSVQNDVDSLLAAHDVEGAFTSALAAQNAPVISLLLHRFEASETMGSLSQPVVLSLLQHVSQTNLLDDTETKVHWLQSALAVSCSKRAAYLVLTNFLTYFLI